MDEKIRKLVNMGHAAGKARKNDNNFGIEELKDMAEHLGLNKSQNKPELVDQIISKQSSLDALHPDGNFDVVTLPWVVSQLDESACKDWTEYVNNCCPCVRDEALLHKIKATPLDCYYIFPDVRSDSLASQYIDPKEKFKRRLKGHSLDFLVQYVWLRTTNLINKKVSDGQEAYLTQEKFVQCIFYDVLHSVLKELKATNCVIAEDVFGLLQLDTAKYFPAEVRVPKKEKGARRIDVSITYTTEEDSEGETVVGFIDTYRLASFELKVANSQCGCKDINTFYEDIIRQAMLVSDSRSSRYSVIYGVGTGYVVMTGTSSRVAMVSLPAKMDVEEMVQKTGKFVVDLPRYVVPVLVLDTCNFGLEFAVRVWRVEPDVSTWLKCG